MKGTTPMEVISRESGKVYCGIDFHKNTSTLCAVFADGREAEPITTIRTSLLVRYISSRLQWKIGIEATGGVNHVVEKLKELGVDVVIFNSNQFRGIGIGGKKTDERDARALANALRLGSVPEVHHRTKYARQIKSLLTTREHLVQARVSGMNHIRGTLREYGVVMEAGKEAFYAEARAKIEGLEDSVIRESLILVHENVLRQRDQEHTAEEIVKGLTKDDERLKRLQTIPGVGLMSSLMMLAVIDDVGRFSDAKQFASYLGLVPSIHASSNVRMMGSITRSGSEMLRRYLVHGARAWMRYSASTDKNRIWAEKVKARRGMNKATVALAHRIARISFAVLRDGTNYRETKKKEFKKAA
jgi:transposase